MDLADPERRLALAYIPATRRPAVAALWALDEAFARVVVTTREPAIGQIKLAWWRDALDRLDHADPPGEPVLQALAAEVLPAGVNGAAMATMVEGWDALLPLEQVDEVALATHAEQRGERLFALCGTLLGGTPPPGTGAAWARTDAMKLLIQVGRPERAASASRSRLSAMGSSGLSRWPKPLRPLGMLYVLASRDPAERAGSPARMLRMLRLSLTGR